MQALFDLLARFPHPLFIIGGQALEPHGVSRQTVDVDCLIAVENREAFDEHLCSRGFRKFHETENFARYHHTSGVVPDTDVLFVDASTFEKLQAGSVSFRHGNAQLQVPALPHLIALKLHAIRNNPAREFSDLVDITKLLQVNPGVVSTSELATLCVEFGPPGIQEKLHL